MLRSLALTQVILEPSDLNSSSYASMFYVSSSFFVSAAVAGRLARSPHRYRNRICRTRSRPVKRRVRNGQRVGRDHSPHRPAAHTHCTNRCTAHDRRGHWRYGGWPSNGALLLAREQGLIVTDWRERPASNGDRFYLIREIVLFRCLVNALSACLSQLPISPGILVGPCS